MNPLKKWYLTSIFTLNEGMRDMYHGGPATSWERRWRWNAPKEIVIRQLVAPGDVRELGKVSMGRHH